MKLLGKIAIISANLIYLACLFTLPLVWLIPEPEAPNPLGASFGGAQYGYTIEYPTHWYAYSPSDNLVVFQGPEGTIGEYASVNIQAIATRAQKGKFESLLTFTEHFRNRITRSTDRLLSLQEAPYSYSLGDNDSLEGSEFKFEYLRDGEDFKQWQIILPSRDGKLFFTWSYRARSVVYPQLLPVAQLMLASWKISV